MNIFLTSRIINTSINWRIQKLIQFSENDNLKISCLRIETLVDFYENHGRSHSFISRKFNFQIPVKEFLYFPPYNSSHI